LLPESISREIKSPDLIGAFLLGNEFLPFTPTLLRQNSYSTYSCFRIDVHSKHH
jgi:hypothetical protein